MFPVKANLLQFTKTMGKTSWVTLKMSDCMNAWNQTKIEKSSSQKYSTWKFNHQEAPHFVEIWETLIWNCKNAVTILLDDQSLTDDVLITNLCLVEQTLKARRLKCVCDDPDDLEVLTTNSFLLGIANAAYQCHQTVNVRLIRNECSEFRRVFPYMIWTD